MKGTVNRSWRGLFGGKAFWGRFGSPLRKYGTGFFTKQLGKRLACVAAGTVCAPVAVLGIGMLAWDLGKLGYNLVKDVDVVKDSFDPDTYLS